MATMTEHTNEHPSPAQVRRGRRTALLLFAIGFGPMILATVMFYTGWLTPDGYTNNGTLIDPVVPVAELNLLGADGEPLTARFASDQKDEPSWLLIVAAANCDSGCETLLHNARQVNVALGKNANRVRRAAYLQQTSPALDKRWDQEYPLMERLTSGPVKAPVWPAGVNLEEAPQILLVDPFGNVMMRYPVDQSGKPMLEDLKHLLKLSQLG